MFNQFMLLTLSQIFRLRLLRKPGMAMVLLEMLEGASAEDGTSWPEEKKGSLFRVSKGEILSPKICCSFENLVVKRFMFPALYSAVEFSNEQQIQVLKISRGWAVMARGEGQAQVIS